MSCLSATSFGSLRQNPTCQVASKITFAMSIALFAAAFFVYFLAHSQGAAGAMWAIGGGIGCAATLWILTTKKQNPPPIPLNKIENQQTQEDPFASVIQKQPSSPVPLEEIERQQALHMEKCLAGQDTEAVPICPHLFISNERVAGCFPAFESHLKPAALTSLKNLQISHILIATNNSSSRQAFPEEFHYSGMELGDRDTPENRQILEVSLMRAFAFIQKGRRQGNVLVHCNAGISRSPAVIIGYLMWEYQVSYWQAFHQVFNVRPIKTAFQDALLEMEATGFFKKEGSPISEKAPAT